MTPRSVLPLFLSVAALAGCGHGVECPPGKECLRYMAWGNPQQLEVEQELLDRFNAKNPDLYVSLFNVPSSSYRQKLTVMLASRTAPDVVRVERSDYPALAAKGYFTDLTPFAESDPGFHETDFFPTAMAEGRQGDKLYALNALFGGGIMYYNRSLFQKAGLTDPYEQWKRGEWTWDRFRAAAKAITKFDARGRPLVYGTTVPGFPLSSFAVWSFGGKLLSPDMKTSLVDDPQTVRAFQMLADLTWKDHVAPTPSQSANSAFTFESGKLGMYFDWMGMTTRYRKVVKSFEWDVCPPPIGPAGKIDVTKGNQLVMPVNTRHSEAAWRFMRFMTSEPTETWLHGVMHRTFPSRIAVTRTPAFLDHSLPPRHPEALADAVRVGKVLPINDRWAEWTQILNSDLDDLYSGRERDAGMVLRRAKAKIDAALAEDPGF